MVISQNKELLGLEAYGMKNLGDIFRNLPTSALYEEIVRRKEGLIAHLGPMVVGTGTLIDCLRTDRSNTALVKLPEKQVNRVIDRTMKFDYASYFSAGLPAISGSHASRPWVELLKSLTRVVI